MRKFSEILNNLDAKEISTLLKSSHSDQIKPEDILNIKEQALDGAKIKNSKCRKIFILRRPGRAVAFLAACFLFVFSLGLGAYAYAAEAKEYKAAVNFFDYYDLSTEGLTRKEIKAIYRDITTKSFTYSKTAQVIESSLSTDEIAGYEILQDSPTPEDIERIWNLKYIGFDRENTDGIHYKVTPEYSRTDINALGPFQKTVVEMYDGDTLKWQAFITEFVSEEHTVVSDGVIVYGRTSTTSSKENRYPWIAKINQSGQIVWKKKLDHGFNSEFIVDVLENRDSTYAVISHADSKYFVLSYISKSGTETYSNKTELDSGIIRAAHFGDGYILQLSDYFEKSSKIVKVDRKGNITEAFSYTNQDSFYTFTDMIEFGGKIFLSAYAVPKKPNIYDEYGHVYELHYILSQLSPRFNDHGIMPTEEELNTLVKDNYSAILLVCDPNGGKPTVFYTVEASFGGSLTVSEDNKLIWDVEAIATTRYSPISNFPIGGTCYIYQYTFDQTGTLINQEKTDEVVRFSR